MTPPRHLVGAGLAGLGAFLVDTWPDLLAWWAARSGSVGDLAEVDRLGVGLTLSAALGLVVVGIMRRGIERVARSPRLGRFDVWGAYALGLGVHSVLLVTVLPAATFALLLADENRSLAERRWLLDLLWVVIHAASAAVAVLAGRALLGRALARARPSPPG